MSTIKDVAKAAQVSVSTASRALNDNPRISAATIAKVKQVAAALDRGFNHPVKNLATGEITFTSQNHGYAVAPDSLSETALTVTHLEINDGVIEGLKHQKYPAFSVQFHPDAAPGPHDAAGLFDQFVATVDAVKEEKAHA